ncbi:MAG: hypothetical protein ACJZ4F_02120 [Candidatus Thalassarchaeaceae archaeon]|tara:strand:+ start:193 stop:711 length:519 start_codon:yes stop_codon:yes gene_type:complete
MALPRRAMEQMGFAICCLMCDAKDIAGSVRCRDCINNHAKSREKLNQGPPKSKADRLAREFITMLTNPSKHIDDSNHGNSMIYYSSLIDKHNGISPAKTAEEIGKRFKELRRKKDTSIIRDVANQNKWSENPPDFFEREELLQLITDSNSINNLNWDKLLSEVGELLEDDDT